MSDKYILRSIAEAACERLMQEIDKANAENTSLKAEVERLTELNKFLEQIDSYLQGANENAYEKRCDELEAEVERLRKAGDEMHRAIKVSDPILDWKIELWKAAKEGMPSV